MRAVRKDSERGVSALEFGLVMPVLLLVIFGLVQYGYHYWSLETASATAREAARRLVVGSGEDCVRAEARSRAAMPAVDGTPSVTWIYGAAASSTPVVGEQVTVTVSFQSLDIGLFPLPAGGVVTETATAVVENIPAAPLTCTD